MVKVSNQLLDEKLNVYLPNKKVFIFELACDRLNDRKQLRYKISPEFWGLFNKACQLLGDDKLKNHALRSFNFEEVVSTALEKCNSEIQFKILPTLIQSINLFRLNSSLSISSDHAITILSSILGVLNKSDYEPHQRSQIINDTVLFFKASVSTEKFNKRFMTSFISKTLPLILDTIRQTSEDKQLISLLKRVIFNKEQLELLEDNTNALLTKNISEESIVVFYKLVIDIIPKSKAEKFEKLFIPITSKFPESSETLLGYISSNKRTLSYELLFKVFDQEFAKPLQNWNLIRSVLELDIEVGLQNAEKVLINLAEQKWEGFISIVDVLINSFIRARDFNSFFQLWDKLLQNGNAIYASPEFEKAVSQNINTLSHTQLKNLVNEFMSKDSEFKFTILSAIVEGFFNFKNKVIFDQSEELFKKVFDLKDDIPALWKLKYQLLSLYENIITEKELLDIVIVKYEKLSEFQFYTLFRIREIVEFDISKFADSFVSVAIKRNSESLKYSFNRWFVLINELFTNDQINTLVSELLKDHDLLLQVLSNNNFFEQLVIIESIIDQILTSITSNNFNPIYNQVLQTIPIQCFPKRVKATLIDSLTKRFKSLKSESLINTIVHILQTPSFKSEIETDIRIIIPIIKTFPYSTIFEIIWGHHFKNIKELTSKTFIQKTIKMITEVLESSKIKEIIPEFHLAFTILSKQPSGSFSDEISKLQTNFINACKSLLNSSLLIFEDTYGTSWLLKVLQDLDLQYEDFITLHGSLKKLGAKIQDTNDKEAKANLFSLLAKYYKFTQSTVEYYEALYLVLRQSAISQNRLLNGIYYVLNDLEEERFNNEYIKTLKSVSGSNIGFVTEIITAYWKASQRSNPLAFKLFINSLSKISNNITSYTNSESIIIFLTEIKSLLIDKSWMITQYGLELIIELLTQLSDTLVLSPLLSKDLIFEQITLVTSNILLFHRFRLLNRQHIVLSLFNSLLRALTNRSIESSLSHSKSSAEALSRLLSNLCEPQIRDSKAKDSVTYTTADLKRSLRKYLPVTLMTYIHLSLKYSFQSEIREALLPGIFNIFDVLSQQELVLVSSSLDLSGRTYYRTLYDEYKRVWKWKID